MGRGAADSLRHNYEVSDALGVRFEVDDFCVQLVELQRAEAAFLGHLQIRKRHAVQIPVGLRDISVQCNRIPAGNQRLVKENIFQIAARGLLRRRTR